MIEEKPTIPYKDILKVVEWAPSLPDVLTYSVLVHGPREVVPHGNASRDLRALKFLGLCETVRAGKSAGRKTPLLTKLALASPDERRLLWRAILLEKYPEIFVQIPPALRTGETLPVTRDMVRAYYGSSPTSGRIATFFAGLAKEAGWKLLPGRRAGGTERTGNDLSGRMQTEVLPPSSNARQFLAQVYRHMATQIATEWTVIGQTSGWTAEQIALAEAIADAMRRELLTKGGYYFSG